MATYLVVDNTLSYKCKTTHQSTPYMKVNDAYLDLTTETKTGKQLKVEHNGVTYIPIQTQTTTASRSSEYTETTGYTGVSKRSSTSGYQGYQNTTRYMIYRYSIYTDVNKSTYTVSASYIGVSPVLNSTQSESTSSSKLVSTWKGYNNVGTYSFKTSYTDKGTRTTTKVNGRSYSMNFSNVGTTSIYDAQSYYYTYGTKSNYDSLASVSSELVQSYLTSSVPGQMSSTTALTRWSNYNTSSTAKGHMSSTTALTVTKSRSSTYETITEL